MITERMTEYDTCKRPPLKTCPECGQLKPLGDYTRDVRQPDGAAFYCRPCARLTHQLSRDARKGAPQSRHPVGSMSRWDISVPGLREHPSVDGVPREQKQRLRTRPVLQAVPQLVAALREIGTAEIAIIISVGGTA